MAARPRLRAALKTLEAHAAALDFEDWIEWLATERANGLTMQKIADAVGISRGLLYLAIKKTARQDHTEALAIAEKEGAEALVDEALEILDNGKPVTNAEAQLLAKRAEFRKWLAGKRDKKFADAVTLQQVNIGTLHLQALKALGHRTLPPQPTQAALPAPDETVIEAQDVELE